MLEMSYLPDIQAEIRALREENASLKQQLQILLSTAAQVDINFRALRRSGSMSR